MDWVHWRWKRMLLMYWETKHCNLYFQRTQRFNKQKSSEATNTFLLKRQSAQMPQLWDNGIQTEQYLGMRMTRADKLENSDIMIFIQWLLLLLISITRLPEQWHLKLWLCKMKSEEDFVKYSHWKLTKLIMLYMELLLPSVLMEH